VPDRDIQCVDCGKDFVFTEREQEWYREKGLTHEPRRCRDCRAAKKAGGGPSRPSGSGTGGGSPGEGGTWHSEDRPRRPPRSREMHKVACATCGKETEVPFRPDPARPVYCRDCFQARGKRR
jgi:CxxC-x17-CxxC domain-containing protein